MKLALALICIVLSSQLVLGTKANEITEQGIEKLEKNEAAQLRELIKDYLAGNVVQDQYQEDGNDSENSDLSEDPEDYGEEPDKRSAYLRFGKRNYMRFGKRNYMRFGKRSYMRFGKRTANGYLRFGRQPRYLRFGKSVSM